MTDLIYLKDFTLLENVAWVVEVVEPISKVVGDKESADFAPISGSEASIFPSEDRHIPRGKIEPLARKLAANPAGPLSRWVLEENGKRSSSWTERFSILRVGDSRMIRV